MRPTKIIAAGLGVLIVTAGLAMSVAGGAVLALADGDGWISAGPIRLSTEAVALVGDDIDIDLGEQVNDGRTHVSWDVIVTRLNVTGRNGKHVFVGVGPRTEVNAYLAGVSVDRVALFHDNPHFRAVEGSASVEPPLHQDFWVASSTDGTLDWEAGDGEWAIAILNDDGSAGIDVAVTGSARVPFATLIGAGLLAGGLLGIGIGATLTYFGVRAVRDGSAPAAPPTDPVPVV